jgi:hypothetical protein
MGMDAILRAIWSIGTRPEYTRWLHRAVEHAGPDSTETEAAKSPRGSKTLRMIDL